MNENDDILKCLSNTVDAIESEVRLHGHCPSALTQIMAIFVPVIDKLKGAMAADDERLLKAGERVGIVADCDTPDEMADEILALRAERDAERKATEAAQAACAALAEHVIVGCASCQSFSTTGPSDFCASCDDYSHYKLMSNPGQALLDELAKLREIVAKLHPRVFRLIAKGREFLVIGIHEPYYRKAYDLIREREIETQTWTEGDEECYARAIIKWHNLKLEREAALAAKDATP